MLTFAKSVKVIELTDKLYVVNCGRQSAVAEYFEEDNTFLFTYEHAGSMFVHEYRATKEGVEEAIWEWLCTLSRFATSDTHKVLRCWGRNWRR